MSNLLSAAPAYYNVAGQLSLLEIGIGLFLLGLTGIALNRSDIIRFLICAEVCFMGIIFTFVEATVSFGLESGGAYALLVAGLAAADTALGLGTLLTTFRGSGNIGFAQLRSLEWDRN